MHFKDIESWSELKLASVHEGIIEDGYEVEQEPEESRTEWTKKYLKALYEKHAECIKETNRRMRIVKDSASQQVQISHP